MQKLLILIELAKEGAHSKSIQISSSELAGETDCSQQTASRWLAKLEEEGLIKREAGAQGQIVELTPEGTEMIKSLWQDLNKAFGDSSRTFKFTGELVSGTGEGGYYIGQEEYQEQFEEKLGFKPYPGTIDLRLDRDSLRLKERIRNLKGIEIEGFSTEERSFGDVKCFPAESMDEEAALILPYRTHHEEDIIEIISPEKIRDKYDLEDGNRVEVEVET